MKLKDNTNIYTQKNTCKYISVVVLVVVVVVVAAAVFRHSVVVVVVVLLLFVVVVQLQLHQIPTKRVLQQLLELQT